MKDGTVFEIASCVPAECDVDRHLVDLSLVREAIVAGVRQELQPAVVGVHRVAEAQAASLQSDVGLPKWVDRGLGVG